MKVYRNPDTVDYFHSTCLNWKNLKDCKTKSNNLRKQLKIFYKQKKKWKQALNKFDRATKIPNTKSLLSLSSVHEFHHSKALESILCTLIGKYLRWLILKSRGNLCCSPPPRLIQQSIKSNIQNSAPFSRSSLAGTTAFPRSIPPTALRFNTLTSRAVAKSKLKLI